MIAENDRGIAQEAASTGTPKRRVTKTDSKRRIIQVEQADQIKRIGIGSRLEGGFDGDGRTCVPRANVLAHVAAKHPFADIGTKLRRDGVTEFDGQITDATAGVEDVGFGKRIGGTGVETRATTAAMIGFARFVVKQLDVGE